MTQKVVLSHHHRIDKEDPMEIKDQILAIMGQAGEPLNAGKVAELGKLERKAVDKAMEQLKKEGKIISPKRCYWSPA
jgi:biotin operon repressor